MECLLLFRAAMKNTPRTALLGAVVALTASVAQAHPGHDSEIIPLILRPFAGLDHFLASLAVAIFAGGVVWLGARRAGIVGAWRRVAVGATALAAVFVLA